MIEPRVWVGCISCYNGGHLVGSWFDAEDAPEEMNGDYGWSRVIRKAPHNVPLPVSHFKESHEELWVFGFEGFHGLLTSECSPSEAKKLAEVLDSIDSDRVDAFRAYVSDHLGPSYASEDWDGAVSQFEDAYAGEWDSGADYAQELAEDLSGASSEQFSEWPYSCIDWERAWRDLEMGGDYSSSSTGRGTVYVFRSA